MKTFCAALYFLMLSSISIWAQQVEILHNSDTTTEGPQLLLHEEDTGGDAWTRMWFKNTGDPTNRWGVIARPQSGATDADVILNSPLVMAYTGVQKFAVGNDGKVRINTQFTLPNMDGDDGQVFKTDGAGVVDFDWIHYTEKESSFSDPSFQIHNPIDGSGHLTFSNGGFANNRWLISADPSGSDAEMRFGWGNVTNPAVAEEYLKFAFDGSEPYLRTDERLGVGTMPYYNGTSGFKLHVVSPDEPAAHFGEQSASNPANGYVTVNKPTTYGSNIMLKLRSSGSTKVDFQDDEAEFFVEALFREDVTLNTANLTVGGDVTIDDLLIIEPRAIKPSCAAGGANNGNIIYYENGATKKLQVCVDGSWQNLN